MKVYEFVIHTNTFYHHILFENPELKFILPHERIFEDENFYRF